jgi:hypothetical protein
MEIEMSVGAPEQINDDPHDWADPAYFVGHWHSWGSPVGLGLFFVFIAMATEIFRDGFH